MDTFDILFGLFENKMTNTYIHNFLIFNDEKPFVKSFRKWEKLYIMQIKTFNRNLNKRS